jgi:hypothetical protein
MLPSLLCYFSFPKPSVQNILFNSQTRLQVVLEAGEETAAVSKLCGFNDDWADA